MSFLVCKNATKVFLALFLSFGCGLRELMLLQSLIRRFQRTLRWHRHSPAHWKALGDRHKWVVVTGCNRSGKTILANLFGNHPLVSVIPNASAQSSVFVNPVAEGCPHIWTEKLERFRQPAIGEPRIASRLAFDWLACLHSPRSVILVDSSLAAVQMPWLQSMFREIFFVGMVRNGYAVAEGIRLKEGYAIERCARHWNAVNTIMLDDAERTRNFMLVRYERLTEDPMEVAKELASLIGIDVRLLEPVTQNGWRLGNEDRRPSKPRNANRDLTARLAAEDIGMIAAQAGGGLAQLGYDLPGAFPKCP